MEVITFRREKVHLYTIPKGTLLFRTTHDYTSDFAGVPVNNVRCIPSQYNVFFYFNPFVIDSIHWYEHLKDIAVYRTTHDIKVVLLLKPSKRTRADLRKGTKRSLIKSCSKTRKACIPGREYDPCFSEEFLSKHPDIMGYVGVARKDSAQLRTGMKGILKPVAKYIQIAQDDRNFFGSPELALYPMRHRKDDIYVKDPDTWIKSQSFNFEYIKTFERNQSVLSEFLDTETVRDSHGFYKLVK